MTAAPPTDPGFGPGADDETAEAAHDAQLAELTADWQHRARRVSALVGGAIPATAVPVVVFDHLR